MRSTVRPVPIREFHSNESTQLDTILSLRSLFFGEVCGSIYILWMLGEIYHSGIDLININATPLKRVDEWLNSFSLGSAD